MTRFDAQGWQIFDADPQLDGWLAAARPAADAALTDPAFADQMDCEGTWFVGVDALPNDTLGRIGAGPMLGGAAMQAIAARHGAIPPLHRGQLSVTWPGYPRPRRGESAAGFRYRQVRDAAHVDGLLPIGPERRRMVKEPHLFILGLPLNSADPDAAPLAVWSGSHRIMGRAFAHALAGHAPDQLAHVDVTEAYQAARREVFDSCPRVLLPARPGQAIVLHRHLLHGVSHWAEGASGEGGCRMVAYFRPEAPGGVAQWVGAD